MKQDTKSTHMNHKKHHNGQSHHEMMAQDFRKRFILSMIFTPPVILLSPLIRSLLGLDFLSFQGDIYVLFALSTVVYLLGGYPFLKGLVQEFKKRKLGMMTLIAVAISVAFFYSSAVVFGLDGTMFFWELVTLIDIMLLGHWIEMRSVMGASRALEELVKLLPTLAHVIQSDGSIEEVPTSELKLGDRVLVKPGERVPSDGIIAEGRTSMNEAMITGESKPVEKKPNDPVIGGAINGEGSAVVEITKTGNETYLAQVIDLVREAQESRSRTQDLANRAAFFLTIISLVIGSITLTGWLALGQDFQFGIERAVTVMVITCPHALGLAVPLVVSVSTSISAKNGLLIRDRAAFERARGLQAIVFDKTGTLTEGEFSVTDVVTFNEMNESLVLELAASLEVHSEHPIAKGVVRGAQERAISLKSASDFRAIPGKGATGTVDNHKVSVVSPGFLDELGILPKNDTLDDLARKGHTVVYVLINDDLVGALALADVIRNESKEAITRLRSMGIQAMMLTGDNRHVAKWVAEELELDDYFAEVLPHEKSAKIREIQNRGLTVAMVGDGVNDAPALAQSDIGIAIGAGTDVAIETADIVLVRNDPLDAVSILGLSRATYSKMVQNLLWATGYNALAIPLAAGVLYSAGILLSPAVGAVLMSLSTVIVAINARLLKIKKDAHEDE
ncbi:MAG: heavy metal translocating P-type ATPase [Candidatus Thorarchaeota archaeon]|jgi:Cu2+-exporting ATPase